MPGTASRGVRATAKLGDAITTFPRNSFTFGAKTRFSPRPSSAANPTKDARRDAGGLADMGASDVDIAFGKVVAENPPIPNEPSPAPVSVKRMSHHVAPEPGMFASTTTRFEESVAQAARLDGLREGNHGNATKTEGRVRLAVAHSGSGNRHAREMRGLSM